jgi:putative ABC transport system permease protein
MGLMFKLALRNVFRNRRRSLITFLAVMIGILSYIILEGFTDSFQNISIQMLKKVETAHLKVYAKDYWDERNKEPLKHRISNFRTIENLIEKNDMVDGATGRINFQARLYKGRNEIPCIGTAIDINGGDKKVFSLQNSIVEGKFLTDGENTLLGMELAALVDAKPGSWVTIEFKDKNGVYDAIQSQVSGIVSTGNPNIDDNVVFVPLKLAQERLNMQDEVTEIAILLKSERKMEQFKKELKKELSNISGFKQKFEVLNWKEQAADFLAFMKADAQGSYIIVYILVVIIIAGIMNTMLMAVYERVREIGTLMALGMKKAQIKLIFFIEGAIIGGIGSIAGMLLGLIFMIQFSKNGINFSSLYGDMNAIYLVKDYIYGSVRLKPFLIAFLIGIVVAIIASYIPARNASKLKPVDALRRY